MITHLFVEARKFLAALSGAIAVAVSAGFISGTAERWTVGGIAVATSFVVYIVENGKISPAPVSASPPAVDAG